MLKSVSQQRNRTRSYTTLCISVKRKNTGRHSTVAHKYGRGCPLLEVILYSGLSFWGERLVRCPEFRGGRFSEVANVLHV